MTRFAQRPIVPGAVIGLMGGGQLGRMTAMAARALGYRVHALDPGPDCPVRPLCDRFICSALDDPRAAAELASSAQVVTCEREDVGLASLKAIEALTPLRPGRGVLEVVQDRALQKAWLARNGFKVGPFEAVSSRDELCEAVEHFGPSARLKAARGGFDGRGQWTASELPLEDLWEGVRSVGLVAEQHLDLKHELSVLVARSTSNASVAYPPAHNVHTQGALETSVLPASLPESLLRDAKQVALRIADALEVVGLLVVEFFWTADGKLLVNELAPRPHNSFHSTEWACETSQFEQLVRAVCGLPLGEVSAHRPTAIANLYGDLWLDGREDALWDLLGEHRVHLRLYDKTPRARRKLGHVACVAESPQLAHEAVRSVLDRLTPKTIKRAS